MSASVDAHLHLWRLARGDYGWITPDLAPLWRDFEPADAADKLSGAGVDAAVLVQAAPTVAETRFLLEHAERHDWILGVVGWVDLAATDAPEQIGALARHAKLKGIRPMIQDIPDDRWMLRPGLRPAFEAIALHDLAFDALVKPRHLPHLAELIGRHPDLRFVIDHGAKPEIGAGRFDDWADAMRHLATASSAHCKLSGLITEAGPAWSEAQIRPFIDLLLDAFGPERLIWGSDWPVLTLAATYGTWRDMTLRSLAWLSTPDRHLVLGGNALRVYRLSPLQASSPTSPRSPPM